MNAEGLAIRNFVRHKLLMPWRCGPRRSPMLGLYRSVAAASAQCSRLRPCADKEPTWCCPLLRETVPGMLGGVPAFNYRRRTSPQGRPFSTGLPMCPEALLGLLAPNLHIFAPKAV